MGWRSIFSRRGDANGPTPPPPVAGEAPPASTPVESYEGEIRTLLKFNDPKYPGVNHYDLLQEDAKSGLIALRKIDPSIPYEPEKLVEDSIRKMAEQMAANGASIDNYKSNRYSGEVYDNVHTFLKGELERMEAIARSPVTVADYEKEITTRLKANTPGRNNDTYYDILLKRAEDKLKGLPHSDNSIPGTPEGVVQAGITGMASMMAREKMSLNKYSPDDLRRSAEQAMYTVLRSLGEQGPLSSVTLDDRAHKIAAALRREDRQKPNLDFYEKLRSYAAETVNNATGHTIFADKTRTLANSGIRQFAIAISNADPDGTLPPPPITWENFRKKPPAPRELFEMLKPFVDNASKAEIHRRGGPQGSIGHS